MPLSVSLPEVVNAGVDAALQHVRTSSIAAVDSYDATTERARLISCVRQPLLDSEGLPVYEDFPVFESVPVAWPRGAASGLSGVLAPGDSVLLVFLEIGIGEWRQRGGTQDPADLRRHSEGYPVALAGIFPDAQPLLAKTPDAWELGFFGADTGRITITSGQIALGLGAVSPVALYTGLQAQLATIVSALNAFIIAYNAHKHADPASPPVPLAETPVVIDDSAYMSTTVKAL